MDFRAMAGKGFEGRHQNVFIKADHASDIKRNHRAVHQTSAIRRRVATLKLALSLGLFLALASVAQGQAEDYYFYEGPKGELVISNKEPPTGTKIIKRLPSAADRETPQSQEPDRSQSTVKQTERSPKPAKDKQP